MNLKTLQDHLEFLSAWNIQAVTSITEVMDGAVNRVFKIQTAKPSPEQPEGASYFLRAYKTSDPTVIQREHDLIRHVTRDQIPAVAPLFTSSGTTFVFQDDKYCALYPQAAGVQETKKDLSEAHARATGKTLALIHKSTQSLPDTGYRVYGLKWDAAEWDQRLDKIQNLILARPHLTDSDQWALMRLKSQRTWLNSQTCTHEYKPQFPSQVLHGDYHEGNIFFGKTSDEITVTSVIDWDQAVYMPRAFEVVRAAAYMFDLKSNAAVEFFKAYLSTNPMPFEELSDGAKAWGSQSDHYVWAVEEVYLHQNERARFFIPQGEFLPFETLWSGLSARLAKEVYFL